MWVDLEVDRDAVRLFSNLRFPAAGLGGECFLLRLQRYRSAFQRSCLLLELSILLDWAWTTPFLLSLDKVSVFELEEPYLVLFRDRALLVEDPL